MDNREAPERTMDERIFHRREDDRTCAMHTDSMRDIFAQIGRMVPIWVFLATIGIIGGVFSYMTYLSHQVSTKAEQSVKETADLARISIKELGDTLSGLKTTQAVMLFRLDDIREDINDLKEQHRIKKDIK